MRFKDLGKTILAIVGAAGGAYTVSQTEVVMPVFAQEVQQTEQAALEARIEELMQRPSVEAILAEEFEAGTIQRVTYDQRAGRTNFRELVYQENIELGRRQPVVVMATYFNNENRSPDDKYAITKRSAIIFKELRNQFIVRDVLFIAYDVREDPSFNQRLEQDPTRINFGAELEREGLRTVPSILIYSYFDLVDGETPSQNTGIIKRIDINRGGPLLDNKIVAGITNARDYWINQWCLGLDNPDHDRKVYKYENDFKIHEVRIPEIARSALVRN